MDYNTQLLKKFIVIEGIDGSGTSTQLSLLTDRLRKKGYHVMETQEPTKGDIGILIRKALSGKLDISPSSLALLFAADRSNHVRNISTGISRFLQKGGYVVCDRYLFSSLAYQSLGCSFEYVFSLNSEFPLPEYCIYLDVPPEISQQRIAGRTNKEIFETNELQREIIENYERAFKKYEKSGIKMLRIDGTKNQEEIHTAIWDFINSVR